MELLQLESCVRGHHVYKTMWTPSLGEVLQCRIESGNAKDPYAVAVTRRNIIVGHAPRNISAACSLFLRRTGRIHCTISGARCFSADLPQ